MRRFALACSAIVVLLPAIADGQRPGGNRPQNNGRNDGNFFSNLLGGGNDGYYEHPYMRNVPYDGKFVLARVWYSGNFASGNEGPGWAHDFPQAELHLGKIVENITAIRLYTGGGNIIKLDDPELFKFPIAYLSEPGGWYPSDKEKAGLRGYLRKGGFLMIDDYTYGGGLNGFAQMKAVLPELNPVRLESTSPIFDSFYRLENPEATLSRDLEFWGLYENNDPKKRLIVMFNVNEDIGDYWQWSGMGRNPINTDTEAFKIAVNFIVYALTH